MLVSALAAALLLLAGLGWSAPALAEGLSPVDIVVAIDNSGSEFGPNGTDPDALRYDAARFAGDFLGSISTAGLDNRVGIVTFGSTAPKGEAVPLSPVPQDLTKLDAALVTPHRLGATNFAAAIDSAAEMFGPPQPGRKRVLLIFTDGVPHLGDGRNLDQLFSEIKSAKDQLQDVEVVLLGVDDTGHFDAVVPRWKAIGVNKIEQLESVHEDELAQVFAKLLSDSLGLDRGDEVRLDSEHPSSSVDIDPYQEALVVTHFSPDKMAQIDVIDPEGEIAGSTKQGRAGLVRIEGPSPGTWTLRLKSGTSATVALDLVPVQAILRNPPGDEIPVGRPLQIEATFQTSDGQVLPELEDYPRYFGATVTAPDGTTHPVELESIGPGVYEATQAVAITQQGPYEVKLSVKGAEQETLQTDVRTVQATVTPYLTSDVDKVTSRTSLQVPFVLQLNGHDLDPNAAFDDDPNAIGVARLFDNQGSLLETTRLNYSGGPDFVADFSTQPSDGQQLTVTASLNGSTPEGDPVVDEFRTVIDADPSSSAKLWDTVKTIILVLALLVALVGALLTAWWMTRPRARGSYRVKGRVIQMNARHRIIGSGWPLSPITFVWGAGKDRVKVRTGRLPLPFGAEEVVSTSKASQSKIVG